LAISRHALWLFFFGGHQRAPMFFMGSLQLGQFIEDMPHFGTGQISTFETRRHGMQQ